MFAVLTEVPVKKKGFFARRRMRKYGAEPTVVQRKAGKIPYYAIELEKTRYGINWDRVMEVAGREAERLLIPRGMNFPPDSGIREYDGTAYYERLLCNSALWIVRQTAIPARSVKIGIYDPRALYHEYALECMPFAESVRVVTAYGDKYRFYSDKAFREYGAGLIVSGEPDVLKPCQIVLAPGGIKAGNPGKGLVFGREGDPGCCYFKERDFRLPQVYEKALPPHIDRISFGAALCWSGHEKKLLKVVPEQIICKGKRKRISKIVKLVEDISLDMDTQIHYNDNIIF